MPTVWLLLLLLFGCYTMVQHSLEYYVITIQKNDKYIHLLI